MDGTRKTSQNEKGEGDHSLYLKRRKGSAAKKPFLIEKRQQVAESPSPMGEIQKKNDLGRTSMPSKKGTGRVRRGSVKEGSATKAKGLAKVPPYRGPVGRPRRETPHHNPRKKYGQPNEGPPLIQRPPTPRDDLGVLPQEITKVRTGNLGH